MNTEEKHLSAEQIDALVETQPGEIEARDQSALFQELLRHLAACEFCQRLVSVQEQRRRILHSLRAELPGEITGNCPSEKSLRDLAGGILGEVEASEILSHAIQCDHCGPLLRQDGDLLNSETSPEEAAAISSLPDESSTARRRISADRSAERIAFSHYRNR